MHANPHQPSPPPLPDPTPNPISAWRALRTTPALPARAPRSESPTPSEADGACRPHQPPHRTHSLIRKPIPSEADGPANHTSPPRPRSPIRKPTPCGVEAADPSRKSPSGRAGNIQILPAMPKASLNHHLQPRTASPSRPANSSLHPTESPCRGRSLSTPNGGCGGNPRKNPGGWAASSRSRQPLARVRACILLNQLIS